LESPQSTDLPADVRPAPSLRWRPLRWQWSGAAVAALVLTLAAVSWYALTRRTAPIPIAVLPLLNLNGNPADDYYADGLTGEIIRNLSIIDGLAVRSQTSSFGLKAKFRDIHDAGRQLRADYILEGSVLRAGQQLRIDVQLVRVRDDFPLWSGRFDRLVTDVFAMQDDISLGIVNNLRLRLGHGRRRYETSVDAYDLYLQARALANRRSRDLAVQGAGIYRQVISKDPLFAPAFAGLAGADAASSAQGFRNSHTDELAEMKAAAEKAIQLDPLLAEAHDALGMAYARDARWAQSEKSFRRAIELEQNYSQAYVDCAYWLLLPLGRTEEAVKLMRRAEETDPVSPMTQYFFGLVLISARKYDEAASHCADDVECSGRARLGQGRIDEAIRILAPNKTPHFLGYLGYAYGRSGRRGEAERLAAEVAPNAFSQALIYAGLSDKDRTLEAFERVAGLGAGRIGIALNSPEFAFLHDDLRAKALRKRVGLPD
jgi:TolB-like protein